MKQFITILGAGESGVGAAVLAKEQGWNVLVSDSSAIAQKYKKELDSLGVRWEEGCHSQDIILSSALVIKSPGIPDKAPIVKALHEKEIPVISEIEFASRYTDVPMIAITGSNGKTTTTSLIHHILTSTGIRAGLGGNIGHSFARLVAQNQHREKYDYYVLELSSFQLDGIVDFRPDIAIICNITPDHLDRYDYKFENYVASKFRITMNQRGNDYLIVNADNPATQNYLKDHTIVARQLPFSLKNPPVPQGAFLRGDDFTCITDGKSFSMATKDLSLSGKHNLMNSMCAALASLLAGVEPEKLRGSLGNFAAVEHRLEFIRNLDGVDYINDSKATNVDSVYYALGSMTRPTVLILGGTDKGNDYSVLEPFIREKVRAIVTMCLDNKKIHGAFAHLDIPIVDTQSIVDAVSECRRLSRNGDTVLLSPACASFDLFKNYEQRGELFKKEVLALK